MFVMCYIETLGQKQKKKKLYWCNLTDSKITLNPAFLKNKNDRPTLKEHNLELFFFSAVCQKKKYDGEREYSLLCDLCLV